MSKVTVTPPVLEPQPQDPVWGGREPVAALVHTPGHWQTFLRIQQVWWLVDSARGGQPVVQANPFQLQSSNRTIHFLAFKAEFLYILSFCQNKYFHIFVEHMSSFISIYPIRPRVLLFTV